MTALNTHSSHTDKSGAAWKLRRWLCLLLLAATSNAALAVPTCTIATGATLSFGGVVALASTPDQTTNSGTTFWVECSADVTIAPTLYSSTTSRVMLNGASASGTPPRPDPVGQRVVIAFCLV
jgi:spore coat protein U-like protein